jgi:hypothetical protein
MKKMACDVARPVSEWICHRRLDLLTSQAQCSSGKIKREAEEDIGLPTPAELFNKAVASTG